MDAPATSDPADRLPRAIYLQVVHTLRALLPAAADPDDTARDDHAAIAHIAVLRPADAEEANLAAQYVAACAQAVDCLRLARAWPNDAGLVLKCSAQSAGMMRQARGWRTALLRAQADRRKRDRATGGRDTGIAEYRPPAEAIDCPPPAPKPAEPPKPGPIAEAERYALLHRKRAALIRRLGRLPDKIDIGGLSPEAAHAIVIGTTPILLALDARPRRAAALAA